jgi:transcriptional regulator GlxA family with amidase domain
LLLNSLPSIVHIRREADKETIRWSLERMREELRHPQPGGSLMAQQLAYTILLQALRMHLREGASQGVGWLFALADPPMRTAITWMHDAPGHKWTLQGLADQVGMSRTVFAQKFKKRVGMTSMEYLTRWRMLLAGDRLRGSDDSVAAISSSLAYETESAFGRAFKRFWGRSPREYRRPDESTSFTPPGVFRS